MVIVSARELIKNYWKQKKLKKKPFLRQKKDYKKLEKKFYTGNGSFPALISW